MKMGPTRNSVLKRGKNIKYSFNFLPVVFEKEAMVFFSQPSLSKNLSHALVKNLNIFASMKFFTNTKPTTLIDLVCYDYVKLDAYEADFKEGVWSSYLTYSYKANSYLFFTLVGPSLPSMSRFFKNLEWLEREQREFFNLDYLGQQDTRNLLLDYSFNRPILLKSEDISMTDDKSSDFNYFDSMDMADFTTLL